MTAAVRPLSHTILAKIGPQTEISQQLAVGKVHISPGAREPSCGTEKSETQIGIEQDKVAPFVPVLTPPICRIRPLGTELPSVGWTVTLNSIHLQNLASSLIPILH